MQPNNDLAPSSELPRPQPVPEGVIDASHPEQPALMMGEQIPQTPMSAPSTQPLANPSSAPASNATLPSQISSHTPQKHSSPSVADDTDLIEKAWVEKAKVIVARTKHDPYEQNRALTNFKADYMKKRFNVDVKQAD